MSPNAAAYAPRTAENCFCLQQPMSKPEQDQEMRLPGIFFFFFSDPEMMLPGGFFFFPLGSKNEVA